MSAQANIVFNAIFAFVAFAFFIYLLKISTIIILDDKEIKFNSHLGYLVSFGRLKDFNYDNINSVQIKLFFGKARRGTHSAGTQVLIDSKEGTFKFRPNILYNNETLILIVGLKEKLQDKVKIARE